MASASLKPILLHGHLFGPNPIKVAIVLEALSLPYTVKMWDLSDAPGGVKGAPFLAINPNGRVPALEDPNTGVTVWESAACISYLLRVYDKGNLLGPRGSEQDRVAFDIWIALLITTLGPMQGQSVWFRRFHPTPNEDAKSRYLDQTNRVYAVLEGQLKASDGRSVLPSGFSAVDAHYYPWVNLWSMAGVVIDDFPLIKKWLATTAERSDVRAAVEKVPKGEKA
ncbi:MAG: hypothetical protein M1832_001776 [Thelocarpon impressellum]|nr:MAG: hypothetical protein M1832_001776 [Thelocarpon impressellum]